MKKDMRKILVLGICTLMLLVVFSSGCIDLGREKKEEETEKVYADIKLCVENTREISYNLTITVDERISEDMVKVVETLGTNVYFPPHSSKFFDCTIDITSQKDYEINVCLADNPGYPISTEYVHLHEGYNDIEMEV